MGVLQLEDVVEGLVLVALLDQLGRVELHVAVGDLKSRGLQVGGNKELLVPHLIESLVQLGSDELSVQLVEEIRVAGVLE